MTPRVPPPDPTPPEGPGRPAADGALARATRGVARATVDVAAPPERVFEALTDPAELAAWWTLPAGPPPAGAGARDVGQRWQVDARPGGGWRVRAADAAGREASVEGRFLVVDPPRTLVTTWEASWDPGAPPSTVRYDLVPAEVDGGPGTRVTVTHTGPAMCLGARPGRLRAGLRPAWLSRGLAAGAAAWGVRRRPTRGLTA